MFRKNFVTLGAMVGMTVFLSFQGLQASSLYEEERGGESFEIARGKVLLLKVIPGLSAEIAQRKQEVGEEFTVFIQRVMGKVPEGGGRLIAYNEKAQQIMRAAEPTDRGVASRLLQVYDMSNLVNLRNSLFFIGNSAPFRKIPLGHLKWEMTFDNLYMKTEDFYRKIPLSEPLRTSKESFEKTQALLKRACVSYWESENLLNPQEIRDYFDPSNRPKQVMKTFTYQWCLKPPPTDLHFKFSEEISDLGTFATLFYFMHLCEILPEEALEPLMGTKGRPVPLVDEKKV